MLYRNGRNIVSKINELDFKEIFLLSHKAKSSMEGFSHTSFFQKSSLRKDFEPVFGKPHGFVPGKYKKAAVYVFEEKGHKFLCTIEPGDRGTGWYVIDETPTSKALPVFGILYMDDPSIEKTFPVLLSKINHKVNKSHLPMDILPPKARKEILSIVSNNEKKVLNEKIKSKNKPSSFSKKI